MRQMGSNLDHCRAACQVSLWGVREISERVGIRLDIANKLCHSVSNPTDEIAEAVLGVSQPQSGTIHF